MSSFSNNIKIRIALMWLRYFWPRGSQEGPAGIPRMLWRGSRGHWQTAAAPAEAGRVASCLKRQGCRCWEIGWCSAALAEACSVAAAQTATKTHTQHAAHRSTTEHEQPQRHALNMLQHPTTEHKQPQRHAINMLRITLIMQVANVAFQ